MKANKKADAVEDDGPVGEPLPDLRQLHERHEGLPNPDCESWARAAEVCLAHHGAPPTVFSVDNDGARVRRELRWNAPDSRQRSAWANPDNATEYGSYPLAIAALEGTHGLFAMERTDTKTGADWYVGPPGTEKAAGGDIEDWTRFEVSGLQSGDRPKVAARVRRKIKQAAKGRSDRPAMVGVVGFEAAVVVLRPVDDEPEDT